MMMTTTPSLGDERVEVLGLVRGCAAYSKNAVKDLGQALKSIAGGELKSYSDLMAMASATAPATPMDSAAFIMVRETMPPVSSSTCSLSTCTAGSALTI